MHNLVLGVEKMLLECSVLRLGDDNIFSSEMTTRAGAPRSLLSIRSIVLESLNMFLKHTQSTSPMPGLHVDFSASGSLFNKNGVIGMMEATDLLSILSVLPFLGANIDRMCGEAAYASVTNV